jgi:hypothetical protein
VGRAVCALFDRFWIFAIIPLVAANNVIGVIEDNHRFTESELLPLFTRADRIKKPIECLFGNKKLRR